MATSDEPDLKATHFGRYLYSIEVKDPNRELVLEPAKHEKFEVEVEIGTPSKYARGTEAIERHDFDETFSRWNPALGYSDPQTFAPRAESFLLRVRYKDSKSSPWSFPEERGASLSQSGTRLDFLFEKPRIQFSLRMR